ncbi:hypothetical protein AAG906_012273 [Vitis piasezkii]
MVTWKERQRLVVFLGKIEDQKGRRMENEGISSILKGKRDGYCDKKGNWRYHEEGAGQWRKKNLLIGKILRGMITRLLRNSIKRFIEENKVNPWLWLPMEARFLIKGANPDLQILENGRENLCGSNRKKVIQTWDSQYFRGETMVVVAKKNYALDQWGKPESRVDDKSLGLLKALPSPIPCRSKWNDGNERRNGFISYRGLFDPQHRTHLKLVLSFFLPRKLSPSSTASSELGNSKMEELGRRKSLYGSSTTTSPSPPRQMNEDQVNSKSGNWVL